MNPDIAVDDLFYDRNLALYSVDEVIKLVKGSIDFFQSMESKVFTDYSNSEVKTLIESNKYCPPKEDYPVNQTTYNRTKFHKDVSFYNSVGVVCLNYTSNKDYAAQAPILATFILKESQNIPHDVLLQILGDDQDDIFSFVNGLFILTIRGTSKDNYGIFRKREQIKTLLQYT